MKKIFAIALLLSMLTFAWSQSTTYDLWFTWKANPASESVTNYVIEQKKAPSTTFIPVVTAPGTTNVWVVRGLRAGTYTFRVIAKNGVGDSLPSNELTYPTNAPSTVTEFEFTIPPE